MKLRLWGRGTDEDIGPVSMKIDDLIKSEKDAMYEVRCHRRSYSDCLVLLGKATTDNGDLIGKAGCLLWDKAIEEGWPEEQIRIEFLINGKAMIMLNKRP